MRRIVRVDDGKRVMLDDEKDLILWDGWSVSVSRNGNSPTRWSKLYAHRYKAKPNEVGVSNGVVFYFANYTRWQGEHDNIEEQTLDEAQMFIEEHYDELEVGDALLKELGLLDIDSVE